MSADSGRASSTVPPFGPPPLDAAPSPSAPTSPNGPLSPSLHSSTIMPGPRLAVSASVGRRRDTTVRSRRGNVSSGRIDTPKTPNQLSSSSW